MKIITFLIIIAVLVFLLAIIIIGSILSKTSPKGKRKMRITMLGKLFNFEYETEVENKISKDEEYIPPPK
jgi:hypothetical protein